MKRLIIGFVVALSLMVGVAGSALAQPNPGPDDAACAATSGTEGFARLVAHAGTCTSHP
jgi:hypothetical protein